MTQLNADTIVKSIERYVWAAIRDGLEQGYKPHIREATVSAHEDLKVQITQLVDAINTSSAWSTTSR